MSPFFQTFYVTALIWAIIFCSVKFVEFVLGPKWDILLEWSGLSFSTIQITWHTTLFNKLFLKVANRYHKFWRIWFLFGVAFGVVLSIASVVLCAVNLLSIFSRPSGEQVLTPIIPGVNIPTSQLFYYFVALLVNGIFHELGHAIAGICERIRVNGFGVFVAFLYPGAFVDFKDESALFALSPTQQLRIYCAGSWHNAVICITSLMLLTSLPVLILPFYRHADGMLVTFINMESPLRGHLSEGDVITSLGDYTISDKFEWKQSYEYLMGNDFKQMGYCVPWEDILTSNTTECCVDEMFDPSLQCFEYVQEGALYNTCLDLKATVTKGTALCNPFRLCVDDTDGCVFPILNQTDTRIIKISRTTEIGNFLPELVFVGHPAVIFLSVETTNVIPRAYCRFLSPDLPLKLETLLHYMFSFGGALAMLNLAPVYYLDGEWALKTFLQMFFPAFADPRTSKLTNIILSCGTGLLVANLILSLWTVI